jgi:hypothetical protein
MDQTLDRLADRLQPRHLLNDLLDFWKSRRHSRPDGPHFAQVLQDNAQRAGATLAGQIRDNPVPALLITTGIAWLIFSPGRERDSHGRTSRQTYPEGTEELDALEQDYITDLHHETAEDPMTNPDIEQGTGTGTLDKVKSKAAHLARETKDKLKHGSEKLRRRAGRRGHELRERAGAAGHELQDRMREGYHNVQERVMEGYDHTRERLKETTSAHPLAAGAAFLGVGLLAGFLLPRTRREDEWFGDASDNIRHKIKETGQELIERGKEVAGAATEAAKSEAERQGLTPEHLKQGVRAVRQETTQAAKQAAGESMKGSHQDNPTSAQPPPPM